MKYLMVPINDVTSILLNDDDDKWPQVRALFQKVKQVSLSDAAIEAAAAKHSVGDAVWSKESYAQALKDLR
jgi:hypothetical protein